MQGVRKGSKKAGRGCGEGGFGGFSGWNASGFRSGLRENATFPLSHDAASARRGVATPNPKALHEQCKTKESREKGPDAQSEGGWRENGMQGLATPRYGAGGGGRGLRTRCGVGQQAVVRCLGNGPLASVRRVGSWECVFRRLRGGVWCGPRWIWCDCRVGVPCMGTLFGRASGIPRMGIAVYRCTGRNCTGCLVVDGCHVFRRGGMRMGKSREHTP